MSWFRMPLRLVDDPGHGDAALAAALRDWGAEAGDARAVARIEQQLAAALAQPRTVARARPEPFAPPAPAWLLGLWAVNVAIALMLSSHVSPRALAPVAASQAAEMSAVEAASRLGVAPCELAVYEAMDALR
jgi:hypothetical protein